MTNRLNTDYHFYILKLYLKRISNIDNEQFQEISSRIDSFRLLGISSSHRSNSYSRRLLEMVMENASKQGIDPEILDLRKSILPVFNPDSKTIISDEQVIYYARAVKEADAFVLASPDYHGSISGSLKNFLDYFWEEFAGKVFGFIVASHEKGLTVMDQMHTAIRQCYGWSMPYGISVNGKLDFDESGRIINSSLQKRIRMMSRDIVTYGRIVRTQFISDLRNKEPDTFAARFNL